MTSELIAYCGINCVQCPAYIAKKTDDDDLRKKTAKEWSQPEYEVPYQEVNCDGCSSSGEIFKHWPPNCPVRSCVQERKIDNCAHCSEFICDKLEGIFQMMGSVAKENLERIQSSL